MFGDQGVLIMWRISLVLLICLVAGRAYSNPPLPAPPKGEQKNQTYIKENQKPNSTDQHGTENSPLFIKVVPPLSVQPSSAEHSQQPNGYTSPEWWLVWVTLILAAITAILAGYTAKLWGATKSLAEDAKQAAERQAGEVKETLRIAQESADAAKKMAVTMDDTAKRQLRAYLSVMVGTALYQDRAQGRKFKGMPRVVNVGQTPAHKVAYRSNAAIMPRELPVDFTFPLPDETSGSGVLGPHQTFDMGKAVDDFCPDTEVDDIKIGKGKILYIWGIVTYSDVFGDDWHTKFCQSFIFGKDGEEEQVFGFYDDRHNDAT